jgi:small subunit ribosomal protein S16
MSVRIRLTRVGATKQPTYRLVVADSRSARDGRAIDTIGHYNPRTEPIELNIDEAKAREWLAKGAQPSDTVRRLFKKAGVLPDLKPYVAAFDSVIGTYAPGDTLDRTTLVIRGSGN